MARFGERQRVRAAIGPSTGASPSVRIAVRGTAFLWVGRPHRSCVARPDNEVGRSLPNSVINQLASNNALALLADVASQDVADAVELLIRTARRPTEICHLTDSCLQWDERVREDGSLDR